jgi:chromosome segregation ATPase
LGSEPFNYFNYFTEIEEHFQRARGTSLFLLSPLDWALIESWKSSAVPLEAVLRGIDLAFEKWRSKRSRIQMVNSIAYCTQAVMTEAQRMADRGQQKAGNAETAPFAADELRRYVEANAEAVRSAGVPEFLPVADSLEHIAKELPVLSANLEALEQRLTVLEQKLIAIARARQSEKQALEARQDLESHLRPWRSKMTAPQISMLEAQFLDRATLASAALPRLSLFYLK